MDVLPAPAQRALGVAVSVIAIGVCVVLTWRTGIAAVEYFRNDIMMPRIWRIPRIWPYAVVPIGSALLACAFVVRLGLYLTRPGPGEDATRAPPPFPAADESHTWKGSGSTPWGSFPPCARR